MSDEIKSFQGFPFSFFCVTFHISLNFLKQIMLGVNFLLSQGHQVNQKKGEKSTNIYQQFLAGESLTLSQVTALGIKRDGRALGDIGLVLLCLKSKTGESETWAKAALSLLGPYELRTHWEIQACCTQSLAQAQTSWVLFFYSGK